MLVDVDTDAKRLRYFHNASFWELGGEDFEHIFEPPFPGLPFFAELVRVDRLVRRPAADPFRAYAERAKREQWDYREIDASHSPHVTAPEALAALLGSIMARKAA